MMGDTTLSRIALTATNATCAHCARLITDALSKEKGVTSVHVDSLKARVMVGFDTGQTSAESILGVLKRSGYPARLIAEVPAPTQLRELQRAA